MGVLINDLDKFKETEKRQKSLFTIVQEVIFLGFNRESPNTQKGFTIQQV